MRKYCIPQPQQVRRITGSFAWIDHRLLRSGYLTVMSHHDQGLYLFLVLAADRHGVSFYRKEKICDAVGLGFADFEVARDRLIDLQLIAFEPYSAFTPNGYYQVLPVDGRAPDFGEVVLDSRPPAGKRDHTPRVLSTRTEPDGRMDPVAWARA
jgi:hypothetical protein